MNRNQNRLTLWKMGRLLGAVIFSLSLSGCFLQPTTRIEKEFNFVDYDAPVVRLAKPIEAELLVKNEKGEWVSIGKGKIPAGAYIKGRSPVDPLKEPAKVDLAVPGK